MSQTYPFFHCYQRGGIHLYIVHRALSVTEIRESVVFLARLVIWRPNVSHFKKPSLCCYYKKSQPILDHNRQKGELWPTPLANAPLEIDDWKYGWKKNNFTNYFPTKERDCWRWRVILIMSQQEKTKVRSRKDCLRFGVWKVVSKHVCPSPVFQ